MPYDVTGGYDFDAPTLRRIYPHESDGSCTTLRDAKIWFLRELDDWVAQVKQDLKQMRASDVRYDY